MTELRNWGRMARILCKKHGTTIATLNVWTDEEGVMYPDTAFIGYVTHRGRPPFLEQFPDRSLTVDESTTERWGYFHQDEGLPNGQSYRITDEPFVHAWCVGCVAAHPLSVPKMRAEAAGLSNSTIGKARTIRV